MMLQPNAVDNNCSIPLSVSSNHKVLSWCRTNEINDKKTNASKIGFKFIGKNKHCSSSDLQIMILQRTCTHENT